MKVRDIMTTEVRTAAPDTTIEEIATMMRDEDVGSIPVVDGNELSAILTDRDIVVRCLAEGKDPAETTAEDIASEDLVTIEPDADVRQAARLMSSRQIRRLPVVEDGNLVGMVALGDIAVKQRDEEVSGEALEEISEGVKGSRGGKKGARRAGSRVGQGIGNRSAREEAGRQRKVSPGRAAGTARRRKTA